MYYNLAVRGAVQTAAQSPRSRVIARSSRATRLEHDGSLCLSGNVIRHNATEPFYYSSLVLFLLPLAALCAHFSARQLICRRRDVSPSINAKAADYICIWRIIYACVCVCGCSFDYFQLNEFGALMSDGPHAIYTYI